jgi:hypothetical protein
MAEEGGSIAPLAGAAEAAPSADETA